MLDRGQPVDAGPYEPDLEAYVNTLIVAGLDRASTSSAGWSATTWRWPAPPTASCGAPTTVHLDRRHQDRRDGRLRRARLGGAARRLRPRAALRPRHRRAHATAGPRPDHRDHHPPPGRPGHLHAVRDRPRRRLPGRAAGQRDPLRAPRGDDAGSHRSPIPRGGWHRRRTGLPVPASAGDRRRRAARPLLPPRRADRQVAFRDRHIDPDDLDADRGRARRARAPSRRPPSVLDASAVVAELNERLLDDHARAARHGSTPSPARPLAGPGSRSSFRFEPFDRNLHICPALLACCEAGLDDDDLRVARRGRDRRRGAVHDHHRRRPRRPHPRRGRPPRRDGPRGHPQATHKKEHEHVQGPIRRR